MQCHIPVVRVVIEVKSSISEVRAFRVGGGVSFLVALATRAASTTPKRHVNYLAKIFKGSVFVASIITFDPRISVGIISNHRATLDKKAQLAGIDKT
jgi:hypothetical protein